MTPIVYAQTDKPELKALAEILDYIARAALPAACSAEIGDSDDADCESYHPITRLRGSAALMRDDVQGWIADDPETPLPGPMMQALIATTTRAIDAQTALELTRVSSELILTIVMEAYPDLIGPDDIGGDSAAMEWISDLIAETCAICALRSNVYPEQCKNPSMGKF